MRPPKFDNVSCSSCGRGFGPGDWGYSHCSDHAGGGDWQERYIGQLQVMVDDMRRDMDASTREVARLRERYESPGIIHIKARGAA